jgi:hypothetical protein
MYGVTPATVHHATYRGTQVRTLICATCTALFYYRRGYSLKYCSNACAPHHNLPVIRDRYYRRTYGITADQRSAMYAQQRCKCLICDRSYNAQALVIDHCHTTGRVRGLLCNVCNMQLGMYEKYNNTNWNPSWFNRNKSRIHRYLGKTR